MPTVSAAAF